MAVCQFCPETMIYPFSLIAAIAADGTYGMLQSRHVVICNRGIGLDCLYAVYLFLPTVIVAAKTEGVFTEGICHTGGYLILQQLRTWTWVTQTAQVTDVVV